MKLIIFIFSCLVSGTALAEQFQAPVTDTRWQVVESPLECSLMQTIPGFGEAGFYRPNGGSLQLRFRTDSLPARQNTVSFQIAAAPWQNSDEQLELTAKPTENGQQHFVLEGVPAQEALNYLQEGRFPIIEYHSQAYQEAISVMLSTIKLNDSLPAFRQCLNSLHPDTFDQVNKLTVFFQLEQASLDAAAQRALNRLADYAKLDDSIRQIRISSHTDSHGRRSLNEPLSDARANAVKNYLIQQHDIPASLIRVESHVAHKPAASNKTVEGRARNRRAEITLIR
jgi:outer membrane protein OmpA-like peptidoglycan-associated protein